MPRSFDKTLTGKVIPNSVAHAERSQFKTCREMHLQNGDKCEVGQFIISKDPGFPGATVVARVEEILQLKGSIADFSGMPDHILLQTADVRRSSMTYQMPHIDLTNQWGCVSFRVGHFFPLLDGLIEIDNAQDILCTVNVQHNCSQHNCGTAATRTIYQEREKTNQTRPAVSHIAPHDIVLNTAQMRDAIHVQKYRLHSGTLNADTIITQSAAREVVAQRASRKSLETNLASVVAARPQNVGQLRRVEALREIPCATSRS